MVIAERAAVPEMANASSFFFIWCPSMDMKVVGTAWRLHAVGILSLEVGGDTTNGHFGENLSSPGKGIHKHTLHL